MAGPDEGARSQRGLADELRNLLIAKYCMHAECYGRRVPIVALSVLALLLLLGCGARTGLDTPDPCVSEGTERVCVDACGTGTQTCRAGYWQACVVPTITESCADSCGSGVRTCNEGKWTTCEVAIVTRPCSSACGVGVESCEHGAWQPCDAPQPKSPILRATIRDFNDTHPDFEILPKGTYFEPGIVAAELGPDQKPVYAGVRSQTTSGQANFNQWYRDTPNVNVSTSIDLPLAAVSNSGSPMYVYENRSFFPIDNQLLGNQGRVHNYHFTLEVHTKFNYVGGETFSFSGDDDVWVFINRRLAIDLGGIHGSMSASVDLDAQANELGINTGQQYSLDLFFAERHTVSSKFSVHTTIADVGSCE